MREVKKILQDEMDHLVGQLATNSKEQLTRHLRVSSLAITNYLKLSSNELLSGKIMMLDLLSLMGVRLKSILHVSGKRLKNV